MRLVGARARRRDDAAVRAGAPGLRRARGARGAAGRRARTVLAERPAAGYRPRAPRSRASERRLFEDAPTTAAPDAGTTVQVLEVAGVAGGGRARAWRRAAHPARGRRRRPTCSWCVPRDPAGSEIGDALRALRRAAARGGAPAAAGDGLRLRADVAAARGLVADPARRRPVRVPALAVVRASRAGAWTRPRPACAAGASPAPRPIEAAVTESLGEPLRRAGAAARRRRPRRRPWPTRFGRCWPRPTAWPRARRSSATIADTAAAAAALEALGALRDPAMQPAAGREQVRSALARASVRDGARRGGPRAAGRRRATPAGCRRRSWW